MDASSFVALIASRKPAIESLLESGLDQDEAEDIRKTFEFKCLLETAVSDDPLVDLLARYDVTSAELRGLELIQMESVTLAKVGTCDTVVGQYEADSVVRAHDGKIWLEDHAKKGVRSVVAQSGTMFLAALAIPFQLPCSDLVSACNAIAGTANAPFWIMYIGGS